LYKNDAAILNIIAANKWKRPIYFTSPNIQLGFDNYLRQDGLTYRLVPVVNSEVNQPWVKDVMMNKFSFGNADKAGVYFDEENRRHLNSIRFAYANAAMNFAQTNRKEDAKQLLHKADKGMLPENFPYAMPSRNQQHNYFSYRFALAAYTAGDTTLGNKVADALIKDMVADALIKDMQQQQVYYENLSETKRGNLINDEQANAELLRVVTGMKESFTNQPKTPEAGTIIQNQAADSNR